MIEPTESERDRAQYIMDKLKPGTVVLVPMRVMKPLYEDCVQLEYIDGSNTGTARTREAAMMMLAYAQITCSMCPHYRQFRDYPNEGHCVFNGWRVLAADKACCSFPD
jgi:hypothetical protein